MSSTIRFKDKALKQMVANLKGKLPEARVGVMGMDDIRKGLGSNAEIGAHHEFGTENLPRRSFLFVPLSDKLPGALAKAKLHREELAGFAGPEGLTLILKKIAIFCEGIVAQAFETGGFGMWPPSDMRYKKVHQTLVETQQLRNSITSEVK